MPRAKNIKFIKKYYILSILDYYNIQFQNIFIKILIVKNNLVKIKNIIYIIIKTLNDNID